MGKYALKVFGAALALYIVAENWSGASSFVGTAGSAIAAIPGSFKIGSSSKAKG